MTNEQAKQKAIQEAWGKHWEKVKMDVDGNGWYPGSIMRYDQIGFEFHEVEFLHEFSTKWRPIELNGFEWNNGWHRIESEKYLPEPEQSVTWIRAHVGPGEPAMIHSMLDTDFPGVEYFTHWQPHPAYPIY